MNDCTLVLNFCFEQTKVVRLFSQFEENKSLINLIRQLANILKYFGYTNGDGGKVPIYREKMIAMSWF